MKIKKADFCEWKMDWLGDCFFTAVLPIPVFANRRLLGLKGGRYIPNPEVKKYKDLVARVASISKLPKPFSKKDGYVTLQINWTRSAKRGDTSGIIKTLEDSLQGIFYDNDSQVDWLQVRRTDGNDDFVVVSCMQTKF